MVAKRVVMVEGTDDEHVIYHLCGRRGIGKVLDVEKHQSVENLLESIPVRLKATYEGDIVGIVLDADENLAGRWSAVRKHLEELAYLNLPANPLVSGVIIDPPEERLLPRVGVWLMPNNQLNGMLENFLAFLVPADSQLFDRVKRVVDEIPEGERLFSEVHMPKVLIHTWLAWQKDPGLPFGTAISARFLDPFHPEANAFVEWLRELFRI